jgi:thymidylate synthase (FAD)
MPIFVARQWVRHRTARLNEISARYSVVKQEFYLPEGDAIAPQSGNNKQGRSAEPFADETRRDIRDALAGHQEESYRLYSDLLEQNLARELSRITLPLSSYTEWYWQIDLHNLFHFLKLRLDPHAQYEIRAYAEVMFDLSRRVCPTATRAFEEHVRGGVRFSRTEFEALRNVLEGGSGPDLRSRAERAAEGAGLSGRAASRFVEKVVSGRQQ